MSALFAAGLIQWGTWQNVPEMLLAIASEWVPVILAMLICIVLHECAHGFAAYRLGDPTAKNAGRLTLNPLKHIDWVGAIAMVLIGFGWAKPVPVNMRNLKHPRRDMAIVGAAGPLMNFAIALVFVFFSACLEAYVLSAGRASELVQILYNFCYYTAALSTGLGIFNLIPFSPLDGSKILGALLPESAYFRLYRYERYGMLVLIALMLLGRVFPQLDFFTKILMPAREAVLYAFRWLARLPFGLN